MKIKSYKKIIPIIIGIIFLANIEPSLNIDNKYSDAVYENSNIVSDRNNPESLEIDIMHSDGAKHSDGDINNIIINDPENSNVEPQQSTSRTVYIGKTGTKYHDQECRTLKGGGTAVSLDAVMAQGRQACKVCGG